MANPSIPVPQPKVATPATAKPRVKRPRQREGTDYKASDVYAACAEGMTLSQASERFRGMAPMKLQLISLEYAMKNSKPFIEWKGGRTAAGDSIKVTKAELKVVKRDAEGNVLRGPDGSSIRTGEVKDLGLRATIASHMLEDLGVKPGDRLRAVVNRAAGTITFTIAPAS